MEMKNFVVYGMRAGEYGEVEYHRDNVQLINKLTIKVGEKIRTKLPPILDRFKLKENDEVLQENLEEEIKILCDHETKNVPILYTVTCDESLNDDDILDKNMIAFVIHLKHEDLDKLHYEMLARVWRVPVGVFDDTTEFDELDFSKPLGQPSTDIP